MKSLPFGCFIATRDLIGFKEFTVNRRSGIAHGPVRTGRSWGKLRPGSVLSARAARTSDSCAAGVHAWKRYRLTQTTTKFRFGNSTEIWKVKIPKGTFYHLGHKYQADKIVLIEKVRTRTVK